LLLSYSLLAFLGVLLLAVEIGITTDMITGESIKERIYELLTNLNDSRQSVVEQLGAPDFSEAFSKKDDSYRVLFYRTQHEHSDGETTKDETTPLVFKNDRLIGWGQDALLASRD
jgi:hypothetical protein